MSYQLVITKGRSTSAAHVLGPGTTVAGRQEGCTLLIKSSRVSRRHCQLSEQQGQLIVKDLGSSNGTLVNGARINGVRVLQVGDELDIGGVQFRVERAAGISPSATLPADSATPIVAEPEQPLLLDEDEPEAPLLVAEAAEEPATPPRTSPAPPPKATKPEEDEAMDFLLAIDEEE